MNAFLQHLIVLPIIVPLMCAAAMLFIPAHSQDLKVTGQVRGDIELLDGFDIIIGDTGERTRVRANFRMLRIEALRRRIHEVAALGDRERDDANRGHWCDWDDRASRLPGTGGST